MSRFTSRAPWLLLVAVSTAVLFGRIVDCGLLGLDTYQLIEASRVRSLSDLAGSFTERLLDTRSFYRPFLKLSIAVDHALFGLEPAGYQLTGALFFAACAVSLGLLAERLAGTGARVAPIVATVAFVSFPRHFEILPVLERRPEMMVGAFLLLALALQVAPRALALQRPPVGPAVVALLAFGSKDNGLVLAPLCLLAVYLTSPRPTWRARARHALVAVSPQLALLAVFLVARHAVVGGLGLNDPWGRLAGYPGEVLGMLDRVVRPEPLPAPTGVMNALVLGLGAALVATLALGAPGRRPAERVEAPVHPGRVAGVGAAWLLLLTLTYAARGHMYVWYTFLLVPGWALLLAAAAEAWLVDLRSGAPLRRATAALGLVLLAATLAWEARYSPVVHPYAEWDRRTERAAAFFDELERRLATAEPGSFVESPPFPPLDEPPLEGPFVFDVPTVHNHAIKSWARLVMPERRIRMFHLLPGREPRETPAAITVGFRSR